MNNIDEGKKTTDILAESEARLLAEMQSVLAINRALVSEIDLDKLLEFIMAQAKHLMNAIGTAVLLLSGEGQQLKGATSGEARSGLKPGVGLPVQGPITRLAVANQRVQRQPTEIHSLLCPLSPFMARTLAYCSYG